MNRLGAILLLLLLSVGGGLADARSGTQTGSVWFNGREYVRLSDWAKPRGIEVSWVKRDESFKAIGSSFRFTANVDSSQARINGIDVWLCFPVLGRKGAVYLSRIDLNSTLQPLLSPAKLGSSRKIRTVVLDPGHGGKDPGFRVGATEEQRHTLLLAQEVRKLLTSAGFKVVLTRASDRFVDLAERPALARRKNADVFISLHYNATEGASKSSVQGTEVYCLTPAGAFSTNAQRGRGDTAACPGNRTDAFNVLLGYHLQSALTRSLSVSDRGLRRARFAVLRDTTMPAALIEAGFLSHPSEGRKILDPTYRKKIARAIVQGLQDFQKAVGG
jgi:N-acetylmuramoyl-L-alanine amidase